MCLCVRFDLSCFLPWYPCTVSYILGVVVYVRLEHFYLFIVVVILFCFGGAVFFLFLFFCFVLFYFVFLQYFRLRWFVMVGDFLRSFLWLAVLTRWSFFFLFFYCVIQDINFQFCFGDVFFHWNLRCSSWGLQRTVQFFCPWYVPYIAEC